MQSAPEEGSAEPITKGDLATAGAVLGAIGGGNFKRHIFLCADQTNAKCCPREAGLASWDYLKKRLAAATIGVDRTVETDVGRSIEGADRARVFLDHRGLQLRRLAIDRRYRVPPVAVSLACVEAEALRRRA